MTKRSTLMDVAQLAGVGKVTVSYVLSGQSKQARISSKTEQKILAAAETLRYRPNTLARMLATRKTDTLAVVFQYAQMFSSGSGFINEVMRGVCAASVEEGFDLMLHTKPVCNPDSEADVLSGGQVDGALILRDDGDPTVLGLRMRHFPFVLFFTRSSDPNCAWVDGDNTSGARAAVEHLIRLGHRKIAMVLGPQASIPASDRLLGYQLAHQSAGLELSERLLVPDSDSIERLKALLAAPDRPTAVFCWADDVAVQAMQVASQNGLRIPRDLSVIGFDSSEVCNRTDPPLTSVRQPIFDMAVAATRLLSSMLREKDGDNRHLIFPLTLDIRGSTAPALLTHNEVH